MQKLSIKNSFLFQLFVIAGFHVFFLWMDFEITCSQLYKYYSVILGVASVLFDIYGYLAIYSKNVVFHLNTILAIVFILFLLELASPLIIYSSQFQKDFSEYLVLKPTYSFRSFLYGFYFGYIAKSFCFFLLLVSIYKYRKSVLNN